MKKVETTNNASHAEGKKRGTFVVKIEYCQNETWQGQVIWAEEHRTERFRSALELIKLMNEALANEAQVLEQESQTKTS